MTQCDIHYAYQVANDDQTALLDLRQTFCDKTVGYHSVSVHNFAYSCRNDANVNIDEISFQKCRHKSLTLSSPFQLFLSFFCVIWGGAKKRSRLVSRLATLGRTVQNMAQISVILFLILPRNIGTLNIA